MDKNILVERINKYQDKQKEGIRCGNQYVHGKVIPVIMKNEVVLQCQQCSWKSRFVPPIFHRDDFDEIY